MARKDMDYEYDDFDVERKPRVVVKKKGGWLGKIVALLLGIIIGIIAGIGGLVGAGYYIVTQVKIKDAADTVKNLTGFEVPLSDYISDEYAQTTTLTLITDTVQVLTEIGEGTGTLGDLYEISPYVKTLVGKDEESGLLGFLTSIGVETTAEILMSKYVVKATETEDYDDRYLTDYIMLEIDKLPFSEFIQSLGFEGNDLITALTYGTEGVDYEMQDGEYVMLGDHKPLTIGGFLSEELNNRIDEMTLEAFLGAPSDEMMRSLFYGAAHRYTIVEEEVCMNQLFYVYDGGQFCDDNGEPLVVSSIVPISGEEAAYLVTFPDGTEQILKPSSLNNKLYAFTTGEEQQAILFPKTTIGDLKDDSEDLINSITLESALNVNEDSHAVIKAIAYGEEGEKRTIKDLRENSPSLINGIELSQIVTTDTSDAITMYLLYGKENVHYYVDPVTDEILMLRKQVAIYDGLVFNEYGEWIEGAVANGTESYTQNGVTYHLVADADLGTVKVDIPSGENTSKQDATLFYVRENGLNVYYSPTTLGDLQDATMLSGLTGRLQLKDVMEVTDNKLLKHLAEERIDNLPEAINNLSIEDVFGDQFYYRTTKGTYRLNENGEAIDNDGNVVAGAELIDITNTLTTDKDKALTGTWKYLLMERKENGTFVINHHQTVAEIDSVMDHMSDNVHAATVRELKLDGLVKNLTDETLNKAIIGKIGENEIKIEQNDELVRVDLLDGVEGDEDHIGDLTVEQLMLYMAAILEELDSIA